MLKALISIFFLFVIQQSYAQTITLTEAEQASLDSMLKNDEFFNMIKKSLKPKSYFEISTVLGNNYFSVKNKRIGASQLESKLVLTPGLAYFHKSGLGFSAAAFLSSFNGRSDFYQFSFTPSYTITKSKIISASVSYTRFFNRDGYAAAATPVQNDLYGTINLKKPWIEPGISVGLSGGRNTTYRHIDTVLLGSRLAFTDTMKSQIRAFSISAFVQHSFEYMSVFNKKDAVLILPRLIVNAGSNSYSEKHYNPYSALFKRILQRRQSLGRLQYNTSFEIQSVACSVDINYIIGKFTLEPQLYLDYYLPDTSDKKFTFIYSMGLSYSF
jgi:hypothetical protein